MSESPEGERGNDKDGARGLCNPNSWNKGTGSGQKVPMANACATMKALYGMESPAKPNWRAWVVENFGTQYGICARLGDKI